MNHWLTPFYRLIRTLLFSSSVLLFCTSLSAQSPVQTFHFDYDGPDTLFVDSSCTVPLDWGHPDEPTCTVSGPGLFLISFELWSISGGYEMGDPVPAGEVIQVVYRAQDNMGNIQFFGFNLTITDTIPPSFITSSLPADTSVQCMQYPDTASVQFTDNCTPDSADLSFSQVLPSGFCSPDSLLRIWTVTDTFGNQASFTQVIQITPDTAAPIIDSIPIDANASCGNWPSEYDQWLSDQRDRFAAHDVGCGGLTLSDNGLPSDVLGDTCGVIEVEFMAEDACGNQSTTVAEFEILDVQPPVLLEPAQNDTFYCAQGGALQAFQDWLDANGGAEAHDSCSAVHWSTIPANPLLDLHCDSLTAITFVADDGCGHTVSTQAEFLFRDTTAPSIDVSPVDTVVHCSSGPSDSLFMTWASGGGYAELSDVCTPEDGFEIAWYVNGNMLDSNALLQLFHDSLEQSCREVQVNGTIYDQVQAVVELEFGYRDLCGNETGGDAVFVLRDTTAPVWTTVPESVVYPCDSVGNPETALESWYDNAAGGLAMDACDSTRVESIRSFSDILADFRDNQDTSCGQTGLVEVTFFAEDGCGNTSAMYPVQFQLIDTMAPMWTADPQSVTNYCDQDLENNVQDWFDSGGMGQWMDGCDTAKLDSFSWTSSYGGGGTGQSDMGPYPDIPDTLCGFTIDAGFYISDACGNKSFREATMTVMDTIPPEIAGVPDTMEVACHDIPDPNDVDIIDHCSPVVQSTFSDSSTQHTDSLECGHYQYRIYRTYTAEDHCGNQLTKTILIEVDDQEAPVLSAPGDTTISCAELDSLEMTAMANDLCSPVDTLYYEDMMDGDNCEQTVFRLWKAQDICGNTSVDTQTITLVDDEAPVLTRMPEDTQIQCGARDSIQAAFDAWVQSAGGAEYFDRCNAVNWFAAFPGTYQIGDTSSYPQDFPSYPDTMDCPPADTAGLAIDFVFYDPCGNAVEVQSAFRVIDTIAPVLSFPDTAAYEYADANACEVDWIVDHPNIFDACGPEAMQWDLRDTTPVTSEMPGDGETVVNTENLSFEVPGSSGVFPTGSGLLEIELFKVDAEGQYEHYRILGEDGTVLGQTDSLSKQCGTGSTFFSLSSDQLYEWYRDDGRIDLMAQPVQFDTLEPRYFINDICPGGAIRARLEFQTAAPSDVSLSYAVDSMPFVSLPPDGSQNDTVVLEVGQHQIRYRLEDCSGNRSELIREVTVLDTISPSMSCPQDTIINLPNDTCQMDVALSLPDGFTDNCGPVPFAFNAPVQQEDRWISFSLDPNTNDYIADPKTISFDSVQADALGNVRLDLNIRANVSEVEAYFIVIGENNDTLGTTAIGQSHVDSGSCATPLRARFMISEQQYNNWAADGSLDITLRPNRNFTPPPGGMDDGINPCDRSAVDQDGAIDSISRISAELSGFSWELSYRVSGATSVDKTVVTDPDFIPVETLHAGNNEILWTAEDASGNTYRCQYTVDLRDTVAPVANCKDIVLRIPPTGNEHVQLSPHRVNDGSFDNCGIESMRVEPDTFSCSQVGQVIPVRYIAEDAFGNADTCTAEIRVERMVLEPSYYLNICDPDTLFLLANLPDSIDPDILTFEWTGPNGFQSQLQNPVIPNANQDFSGTYTLRATGLNDCYSEGSVEIVFEMLQTPVIETETPLVCEGENIQLNTIGYSGDVSYKWYRGTPPNGVLLGSTVAPSFTVNTSPPEGTYSYYVVIETPECSSNPSNVVEVEVITSPQAQIDMPIKVLCEGETLSFTSMSDPLFEFEWTGPNGFTSDLRNPVVTDSVTEDFEGEYSLVVSLGNCVSQVVTAEVIVNPSPVQPIVQAPAVVCAGDPLTITVTNINDADTYRWIHPNGTILTGQDPSLTIQNTSTQEAGPWLAQVVEDDCASPISDTVFIGVEDISYFNAENDGPICEDDSVFISSDQIDGAEYQWSGPDGFTADSSSFRIPANEGVYRVTVTTENGCSAMSSTSVEVKPRPEITGIESQGIICSDGELDVCFNISVFPPDEGNYQYEWEGPNNYFSDEAEPCIVDADDSDNGVYTLTVIQDGCRSKAVSTILNVVDVSSQPPLFAQSEYCTGDSIILETDPYGGFDVTYVWITPDGQRMTSEPELVIPSAGVEDGGVYELFIMVEDCETEHSEPVQITVYERPQVPEIEGTTSVCVGDSLKVRVNLPQPGVTYQWTGPSGVLHTGNSWTRYPAADNMQGEYRVEAVRGICRSMSSDPIYVDVQSIPQVPEIASHPDAICKDNPGDEPLCIDASTATSGAVYEWLHVESGNLVRSGEGLCIVPQDLDDIPVGLQHFYVRAVLNGCRSSFSVPVSIQLDTIPDITADAGTDDIFCPDAVNRLQGTGPGPAEGIWMALNPSVLVLDPTDPNTEVVDLPEGETKFVWTLSNGACTAFSSDTVRHYLPGPYLAQDDQYMGQPGRSVSIQPLLNDQRSTDSFSVTLIHPPAHGQLQSGDLPWIYQPESGFIGRDTAVYEVCAEECPMICDTASIYLKVGDATDCTVPTIFTPNNDGINDYFVIPCLSNPENTDNTLVIFNQWGDEVFRASPYENDWRGTYKGDPLPPGTYFYSLKIEEKQLQRSGFIVIER